MAPGVGVAVCILFRAAVSHIRSGVARGSECGDRFAAARHPKGDSDRAAQAVVRHHVAGVCDKRGIRRVAPGRLSHEGADESGLLYKAGAYIKLALIGIAVW